MVWAISSGSMNVRIDTWAANPARMLRQMARTLSSLADVFKGIGSDDAVLPFTAPQAQTAGQAPAARAVTQALPYFNVPRIGSVRVSPSNTHAAFLWVGSAGRQVLAVIDLAEPTKVKVLAANPDLDIRGIHWVNDRRLVFDYVPPELVY